MILIKRTSAINGTMMQEAKNQNFEYHTYTLESAH